MDAQKYEATQRLQQGCATLTDKVEQLNGLVRTYLDILDKQVGSTKVSAVSHYSTFWHTAAHIQCLQAGKIETEKLKAIGVRNAVATLEEVRTALHSANKHNLSDAPELFCHLGDTKALQHCCHQLSTMQDRKRKSKELHTQVDDKQQQLERQATPSQHHDNSVSWHG